MPASPSRPPLRVALIGYGLGGAAFHAPLIATTFDLELSAVVTGDAGRQAQAAGDYPQSQIIETVDDLWARANEFDLVVVCTPNRTHAPLATLALRHGLAVVVDKPLATSSLEARALRDVAVATGRPIFPYQNRRWDGDFLTVQDLLAHGALGDVFRFESNFERWRPAPKPGWRESSAPEEAGGLLFDLGSHLIDQALVLFGPVASVYAELDRRRPGVEVDDDAWLALTHHSGVRTHLYTTVVSGKPAPRFRLFGLRGTYIKWGPDVQEGPLRSGQRPGGDSWGVEPPDAWGTVAQGETTQTVPTRRGDYRAFYAGVAAALRGDAPPPVAMEDALATLEVIECAQRSAAEGVVVRPDSLGA